MADNELGAFLRARRDAVTPGDVGLPPGGRRRTPGLRRSELATLAGISVDYLVRLEQGRDQHPSTQVLTALADALRLTADERVHLRNLAKVAENDFLCPEVEAPSSTVRASAQSLLERLEPAPAVLLNRTADVLACTSGYERLAGPLGILDAPLPNLVRYVFTDARAREFYPDWERVADEHVAGLRMDAGRVDPYLTAFAEELALAAGPAFSERLESPLDLPGHPRHERLVHPDVGELSLECETLDLAGATDQRLLVYLPADDVSGAALDRLAGRRPGALRAVSS
ncbi:transcriptional regulator with XRE-family HTH domain [Haloactinopolyspora alba]|uniref:Transcriptional regulator with XRE-family HTH domain n=1 Tax=Haloactinopolyspora alba TaxID=648780 RepID=A0A2P8DKY4_9ACTN|nr:helix-turn-helix transcriptional regulator [Haloactinopolyspora alba]PSK97858.1 transcriptional regulator with XRE-family HTH domain [Haloactinopolyspora alba]